MAQGTQRDSRSAGVGQNCNPTCHALPLLFGSSVCAPYHTAFLFRCVVVPRRLQFEILHAGCYQATQIRPVRFLEAFRQPWPTLPQKLLFLGRRSLIEVSSYCQGFLSFSRIGGLVSSPPIAS